MAFHDCDVEEADILEVQSVSDMFSAFKTPAADAVKLIGGDDIAVFSPQLGLMVVTSQYDLEEPATTSQTVILSLADAECTWPDPPEYISDIVFECRWPSGANLVTEFQSFSDENATPSPSLEHYRERFSEGGICTVFSECDEVETAYRNRISELTPGCMKSCGATTELRSNDLPSFIKKANSAEAMATEIAIKEIIEAM